MRAIHDLTGAMMAFGLCGAAVYMACQPTPAPGWIWFLATGVGLFVGLMANGHIATILDRKALEAETAALGAIEGEGKPNAVVHVAVSGNHRGDADFGGRFEASIRPSGDPSFPGANLPQPAVVDPQPR